MRFLHLSDLHIGKRVNEFSMIEEQKYILNQILNVIDNERVEFVLIAGDIYDKSVPSAEAVLIFDEFLTNLADRNLAVFVISGNHDSPERIAFGNRLMKECNVYMSPVFNGDIRPITLKDKYGSVNIYMLPFIKPVNVKKVYPDAEADSYSDAVKFVIDKMDVNKSERNIIVAHQLVTGAGRCDSEDISIGGMDNEESLNQAIGVLNGLTEGNRLVGIISHVAELKDRISRQIIVTKNITGGSSAKIEI